MVSYYTITLNFILLFLIYNYFQKNYTFFNFRNFLIFNGSVVLIKSSIISLEIFNILCDFRACISCKYRLYIDGLEQEMEIQLYSGLFFWFRTTSRITLDFLVPQNTIVIHVIWYFFAKHIIKNTMME
jgi:hypothetical protein